MNHADPLAALRDIHVPDPPGFWPPAPGWIGVVCLATALGILAGVFAARRWRAGRFRREALEDLVRLRSRHRDGAPDVEIAMELSTLVRRVALARHPRGEVAGLTGARWMAWIESTHPDFDVSARTALLEAPYARHSRFDASRALTACEHWIRRA